MKRKEINQLGEEIVTTCYDRKSYDNYKARAWKLRFFRLLNAYFLTSAEPEAPLLC